MPEAAEETTQTLTEETTLEAPASTEIAAPEVEASEPQAEASQPELTREQVMASPQFVEMQNELRAREEARKTAEADAAFKQQQIEALTGRVAAQTDPVEAARQQWEASKIDYEIDENAAFDAYLNAREQRAIQQAQTAARNDMLLEQQLATARPYGINTREDLQREAQMLNAESLGIAKLYREGKLEKFMEQQKAAAEQTAAAASRTASGMQGRATGPGGGDPDFHHVGATTFITWAPHKQEVYVKEHGLPPDVTAFDE